MPKCSNDMAARPADVNAASQIVCFLFENIRKMLYHKRADEYIMPPKQCVSFKEEQEREKERERGRERCATILQ